jgi:hypothetical protein
MTIVKAGGINGVFCSAGINFFKESNVEPIYGNILTGYIINAVMGATTGALIGMLTRKIR